jgi:hypothetical protein
MKNIFKVIKKPRKKKERKEKLIDFASLSILKNEDKSKEKLSIKRYIYS